MEPKKLSRSLTNRWLAGVCGGLGEYFGIDPTVVRLGFLLLTVLTGFVPFLVLYVLAAIIMPNPTAALTAAPPPASIAASPSVPPVVEAPLVESVPAPGNGAPPSA